LSAQDYGGECFLKLGIPWLTPSDQYHTAGVIGFTTPVVNAVLQLSFWYEGCFQDFADNRQLPHIVWPDGELTPDSCIYECALNGYLWAGLQDGNYCWCGDDWSDNDYHYPLANDCHTPCPGTNSFTIYEGYDLSGNDLDGMPLNTSSVGDCQSACISTGGCVAFSWNSGNNDCYLKSAASTLTNITGIDAGISNAVAGVDACGGYLQNSVFLTWRRPSAYLGCYQDNESRDLPHQVSEDEQVSIETCVGLCAEEGYAFAGSQYYGQCFCGNSYNNFGYGRAAESNCNLACLATGETEFCGGAYYNSIYYTANYLTVGVIENYYYQTGRGSAVGGPQIIHTCYCTGGCLTTNGDPTGDFTLNTSNSISCCDPNDMSSCNSACFNNCGNKCSNNDYGGASCQATGNSPCYEANCLN